MKTIKTTLFMTGGLAVAALSAFAGDADEKFKMMDTDGDGKVTRAEHAASAQTMFGKMDANTDGTVTTAELDAGHAGKKSSKLKFWQKKDKDDGAASEKMSLIDTNADGQISRAEHEAGSEKIFTQMDVNDDGVLTKDECDEGSHAMKKDK